ncbi:MAG: GNAT family N-acetyltransferase [Pseudomonadota bacterium]|nr:GNAT family N-acetyltransferase [Pseudomonadota bacterium]MEE3101351.1 GNAT family N-acetyltransferase [Pseudomonadota bacterium]
MSAAPDAAPDAPLTGPEAEAAAALHAAAFSGPDAIGPWSADDILGFCASPGAFRLTAPDPSGLAALLLGRVVGPEAELVTLATRPQARRRGLARALVRAFARRAAARGAETAFLEVAEPNAPARALYLAEGWGVVGRRRDYYRLRGGGRADALVMSRDLRDISSEIAAAPTSLND